MKSKWNHPATDLEVQTVEARSSATWEKAIKDTYISTRQRFQIFVLLFLLLLSLLLQPTPQWRFVQLPPLSVLLLGLHLIFQLLHVLLL